MDWLGIGVTVIGVAFLILVIVLIKPLNKLANVLGGLQKTTDNLPAQVDDMMSQTKNALQSGNDTLAQINSQIKELSPIFHTIGDAGRATNHLSTSIADKVMKVKTETAEGSSFITKHDLEGLYGLGTLIYYVVQQQKNGKSHPNV
ncbi:DUF948 domain-containing protein [Oceanobacillus kapialis]|uniref:DUF948 domain-containing protein n=1 Tax=Oceanobacillus kapialis TaxID=481353 RepID=A0ABW5PWB1_9BACI